MVVVLWRFGLINFPFSEQENTTIKWIIMKIYINIFIHKLYETQNLHFLPNFSTARHKERMGIVSGENKKKNMSRAVVYHEVFFPLKKSWESFLYFLFFSNRPKITPLFLKKPTVQAQLHKPIPLPSCPVLAFFESFYQTTCPNSTQNFIATWNLHRYRSGGKCIHWHFFGNRPWPRWYILISRSVLLI